MAQIRIKQDGKGIPNEIKIYENGNLMLSGGIHEEVWYQSGSYWGTSKDGAYYLNWGRVKSGAGYSQGNDLKGNNKEAIQALIPFVPTKIKVTWKASCSGTNAYKSAYITVGNKMIYLVPQTKTNPLSIGERTDIYSYPEGVQFTGTTFVHQQANGDGGSDSTRMNLWIRNLSLLKK